MKINPGDTCIVIRGPNRDRLLITKHFDTKIQEWCCEALQEMVGFLGGGLLTKTPAGSEVWAESKELRPIRDQPGTDEMIIRCGLPHGETV